MYLYVILQYVNVIIYDNMVPEQKLYVHAFSQFVLFQRVSPTPCF